MTGAAGTCHSPSVNAVDRCTSEPVKGEMKRQQSLMELSPEANGTRLQYRLELEPSGLASAVISQDRLKHDIDEQFTAIVGEMVRRKK